VSGNIFASPSARQIEECARLALGSSLAADGVAQDLLVIINNYTGDVLNFGLAIERIMSWKGSKVNVESVVVADDVSIGRAHNLHGAGSNNACLDDFRVDPGRSVAVEEVAVRPGHTAGSCLMLTPVRSLT
jgi:hypothetical protein